MLKSDLDLASIRNLHFLGIKGVGMTALALYAQDMGKRITGSDVEETFVTQEILQKRKIAITTRVSAPRLPESTQALVYSAAFPNSPQRRLARRRGIPQLSFAQALAWFTQGKQLITTCGVGGKTTTAAMIATILQEAGWQPSFVIGVGNVANLGVPGRFTPAPYAVLEADEYVSVPGEDPTPKFLYLSPSIIVTTNIEHDHPDVYPSLRETKQIFCKFMKTLTRDGLLVVNEDDPNTRQTLRQCQVNPKVSQQSFGLSRGADWRIRSVRQIQGRTSFTVQVQQRKFDLDLVIPGVFNARNATAALIVASHLGIDLGIARQALGQFRGCRRRFESVGTFRGMPIIDDYAHHPREIEATLTAARAWFPDKRLRVVFQPHTFSRTKALLPEFAAALGQADEVIITDIYASAREKKDPTTSAEVLAKRVLPLQKNSQYLKVAEMLEYLRTSSSQGDLLLTLGAGDVYQLGLRLLEGDTS